MNWGCSMSWDRWQPFWSRSSFSLLLQQASAVACSGFPKCLLPGSLLKIMVALFTETSTASLDCSLEPLQVQPAWECLRPHRQKPMASQGKHSTLEIPSTQTLAAQGLKCWRPWLQSKERQGLRPQTFAFIFLCDSFADGHTELLDSHLQWISNQLWMDADFSPISPPLGSGWLHPWANCSLTWTLHSQLLPRLGHDSFFSAFTP